MKKILIIDDDTNTLAVVKHILTKNGFNVVTYSTGINVTDVVKIYKPNLVLLDIRLPGKLGTDVCGELKKVYHNLPIILFSTYTEKGVLYEECHADAFISKPFDVGDLVTTINLHLQEQEVHLTSELI